MRKTKIDFIGIGVQKAGTTWLYKCLYHQPDFSLPPVKELHYFSRSFSYPSPNRLKHDSLGVRLLDPLWTYRSIQTIRKNKNHRKVFDWYKKFYYANYNDDWYLSLFDEFKGLKGEITPAYSILKKKDIKRMYSVAPNARLILILRNPVYRAWSHFRYSTGNSSSFLSASITRQRVFRFMNSKKQELRSDYIKTLDNFTSVYPNDQLLICFYDAIQNSPVELLHHVVDFIGGDTQNIRSNAQVLKKINVSREISMPADVFSMLKEKYHDQIAYLSGEFGGYFTKWYKDLYAPSPLSIKSKANLAPTTLIDS